MDKKPPKMISKVNSLLRKVFRAIVILLTFLILLYVGLKLWEYKVDVDKNAKVTNFKSEQKQKYEVLGKGLTMSLPLFVGSPSLEFVKGGSKGFIFAYLLGEDYSAFQEALGESAPIVFSGSQVFGSGCKKQACSELKAAFLVDPGTSEFLAAILDNGKPIYYGLAEGKPVPAVFEKWAGAQSVENAK
jgi:hypothetical protein